MSDWGRCHDFAQRGLLKRVAANAGEYGWHSEFYVKEA
jgi:hypothetical protein